MCLWTANVLCGAQCRPLWSCVRPPQHAASALAADQERQQAAVRLTPLVVDLLHAVRLTPSVAVCVCFFVSVCEPLPLFLRVVCVAVSLCLHVVRVC